MSKFKKREIDYQILQGYVLEYIDIANIERYKTFRKLLPVIKPIIMEKIKYYANIFYKEDLEQDAMEKLLYCLRSYDKSKGIPFINYYSRTLRLYLNDKLIEYMAGGTGSGSEIRKNKKENFIPVEIDENIFSEKKVSKNFSQAQESLPTELDKIIFDLLVKDLNGKEITNLLAISYRRFRTSKDRIRIEMCKLMS